MVEHDPLIQLTDERDRILRGGTMDEAQEHGHWHRLVRVMVFDPTEGQYLLQQVPENAYYDEGLWDTTASGHVDEGEAYRYAGERKLEKEMGITGLRLVERQRFRSLEVIGNRILKRHNVTFVAPADRATLQLPPDTSEVAQTLWVDAVRLREISLQVPGVVTNGLARFAALEHERLNPSPVRGEL